MSLNLKKRKKLCVIIPTHTLTRDVQLDVHYRKLGFYKTTKLGPAEYT